MPSETALTLVTGNRYKAEELREILPGVDIVDIDLPEIQAIECKDVITAKLYEARKHLPNGNLVVEDTALHLDCLNRLPGALIKWFLECLDCSGIFGLCERAQNYDVEAVTVIGYLPVKANTPTFFLGSLSGKIVSPRGDQGFGWDSIFVPSGYDNTLAEMDSEMLREVKMRRKAAMKLAAHLESCAKSTPTRE